MEDIPGEFSFLNPRDPSISLGNRPFEVKRMNLLSRFGDETEHAHISKSGKVKVYLRIKPTKKDATLVFAPPQVSEEVCTCVCEDYVVSITDILKK
jgi:hypothetical protein